MEPPISPLLYAVLLFLGMLTLLEVGRRLVSGVGPKSRKVSGAAWARSKVPCSPCLA